MLKELLHPKVLAVIGVSPTSGEGGFELVANLQRGGYRGGIVPVGPLATEIHGLPCYGDLADYKGEIDLGVLLVPAERCKEAAKACINAGAKAIVVLTPGFRESGAEGLALERDLTALCLKRDVRLLGPNCTGLLNTANGLNLTPARSLPAAGGLGILAQSGDLGLAMLDWCASRKIGVSKAVSLGNKADLNEVDFLEAFAEDEETRVIVAYLETIVEGSKFLQAAEQCAARKPIVVLMAGTTEAGARAASSHTGSLAGADVIYTAAFKHSGVLRADTFERLFDDAVALGMQPLPAGRRVTVLTNAGGAGILAADAVESAGLELGVPVDATLARLGACLPVTASLGNPVDIDGDADPERFIQALRVLEEDPNSDAMIVLVTPREGTRPLELARALEREPLRRKPLLVALMGGAKVFAAQDHLNSVGIPSFPSPERAVGALKAMVDHAAWKNRPPRVVVHFPVNRRRVDRILRKYTRMGRKQISEMEAKDLLEAYGFRVLPGALAADVTEAVEAAERIGYPVVMKVVSPDVVHKSDIGGVVVSLACAEQVRDGWDLILARARRHAPSAQIRGVYVEKMGRLGREVILGLKRDPQFGPMLMFGLGGIFVEVLKDVAFQLAPITADEAMHMLKLTRSYGLLEGARGQKPVDMEAIADALQRISQLSTDYPQITELDINPFIVGEVGTEAYAADARLTLSLPSPPTA